MLTAALVGSGQAWLLCLMSPFAKNWAAFTVFRQARVDWRRPNQRKKGDLPLTWKSRDSGGPDRLPF